MRRQKSRAIRNKLDLSDRAQVRLVKKRLRLSDDELAGIVARIGNSISVISKHVALQRPNRISEPTQVPAAVVVASARTAETVASGALAPTDPPACLWDSNPEEEEMRRSTEHLYGTENDWAERLRKEAESWHRRKSVPPVAHPPVAHKGVQVVRVPKRKLLVSVRTTSNR